MYYLKNKKRVKVSTDKTVNISILAAQVYRVRPLVKVGMDK